MELLFVFKESEVCVFHLLMLSFILAFSCSGANFSHLEISSVT